MAPCRGAHALATHVCIAGRYARILRRIILSRAQYCSGRFAAEGQTLCQCPRISYKPLKCIEGGGGGGCPILVFGIRSALYVED
jgi:hypothetical protein